jgi:hypothetical protein
MNPWRIGIILLIVIALVVLYPFLNIYFVEFRPRIQFPQKVRNQISPIDLRDWAMQCLNNWDTNSPYGSQEITNIHPAVRGLWIHEPHAVMYSAFDQEPAYVMVYYGAGGCGHWGMEIGPTDRSTPPTTEGRRYTYWAPGVCFFDGQ